MVDGSRRDPRSVLDRGLQAERTRLAWSRTALSFSAVGALLLHNGIATGERMRWVPGIIGLSCAAATYLLGVIRYHATNRKVAHEQSMTSAGAVRTLTALTILTVVVALVLITT